MDVEDLPCTGPEEGKLPVAVVLAAAVVAAAAALKAHSRDHLG